MSVRAGEEDEERRFWRALGRARAAPSAGGAGARAAADVGEDRGRRAAPGGTSDRTAPEGGAAGALGPTATGGAPTGDRTRDDGVRDDARPTPRVSATKPRARGGRDAVSRADAGTNANAGPAGRTLAPEPTDPTRPATRPVSRRRVGAEERRVASELAEPETREALERHREEARRLALRTMLQAAEARATRASRARRPPLARGTVVRVLDGGFAGRRATVVDADYIESRALLSFDPDEPPHWVDFGNIGAADAAG